MRYNSAGSRKMSKEMDEVDGSSNRTREGNRVKVVCDEWHTPAESSWLACLSWNVIFNTFFILLTAIHNIFGEGILIFL